MAIEFFLDKIDDLADGIKEQYVPNVDAEGNEFIEGVKEGFHLDLSFSREGWATEDVKNLKSAYQKASSNFKTERTKLEKFEGINADEAKVAIQEKADFANKDWTKDEKVKAQIQAREDLLTAKHEKTDTEQKAEIATLTTDLHEHLVDVQAISAINKNKGNVKLLLPHVRQFARVERDPETGKRSVQIVEADGTTVRISMKTGSTDPMDFDEFVSGMSKMSEFMQAFEGSGSSGSGSSGSDRTGSLGSGHRISYEDARDPRKYRAAKEAAENAKQVLEVESQPMPGGAAAM